MPEVTVTVPPTAPGGRRQFKPVVEARERAALDLLVAGATYDQIADVLGLGRRGAVVLVQRVLNKRAKDDPEVIANARTLVTARLDYLLSKWFPRAAGDVVMDGLTLPPDKDAAEITLKILDRLAAIHGVSTAPKQDVVQNNTTVINVGQRHDDIMRSLDHAAERQQVIEGTLVTEGDA